MMYRTGKRLVSYFLTFCLLLTMAPAITPRAHAVGESRDDPYVVNNDTELRGVLEHMSEWNYHYVRLGDDITLDKQLVISGELYLDLAGHALVRNDTGTGNLVIVRLGQLTLDDTVGAGYLSNAGTPSYGGGVTVQGGSFIMDGGIIRNCSAAQGGGVSISSYPKDGVPQSGSFTMNGGSIIGNSAVGGKTNKGEAILANGGGVSAYAGSFVMNGGTIEQNEAVGLGGGVFVNSTRSFTMTEDNEAKELSVIADNKAKTGGGVYVSNNATFTMTAGDIRSNEATDPDVGNGGGVYLTNGKANFKMSSGSIRDNLSALNGGGVYINYGSTFNLSNGQITGNHSGGVGGGVYVSSIDVKGTFEISGSGAERGITIQDNHMGDDDTKNNVYLPAGMTMTVTGPLDKGDIGVTLASNTGICTSGYSKYSLNASTDPMNFFSSDLKEYEVDYDVSREDSLIPYVDHTHETWQGGPTVTFKRLASNFSGGTLSTGSYYLSSDITLTQPITINGTVNFDLNGYAVIMTGGDSAFFVPQGAQLALCDCNGSGSTHTFNAGSYGLWELAEGGSETVSGGVITGGRADKGGGVYALGTFNMYGGAVIGNRAGQGGGIYFNGETFRIEGKLTVKGNTATDGTLDNVYFAPDKFMTVVGPIDGTSMGITMERADAFTKFFKAITREENMRSFFTADKPRHGIWKTDDGMEALMLDAVSLADCDAVLDLGDSLVYTGEPFTQSFTIHDQLEPDEVLVENKDYTVSGDRTAVDTGTYTLTATGIGDYIGETSLTWTIVNAEQAAPELTHTDETIKGKKDGTISGISDLMEMKAPGETDFTACTEETITDLEPGDYVFRFAERANYNVGAETTVTIGTGRTLTVTFDSQGGSAVTAQSGLAYGDNAAEPEKPVREGWGFAGWFRDVAYSAIWNFEKDTLSDDVTFYAKWAENAFTVTGIVTLDGVPESGAAVELKVGSRTLAYTTTAADGSYELEFVDPGEYNLVVTTQDGQKLTKLMVIDGDMTENESLVKGRGSSLELSENAPDALVGGLDTAAANSASPVSLTLTISPVSEEEVAGEIVKGLKELAEGQDLLYYDFALTGKTGSGTAEERTETDAILELLIPMDTASREEWKVYRWHDGEASAFEENEKRSASGSEFTDGTYVVENGQIILYTDKFSVYAFGCKAEATPVVRSSYSIRVIDAANGLIKPSARWANEGVRVSLTPAPEEGFKLGGITVVDAKGNFVELTEEDGVLGFVMPASKVEVSATFLRTDLSIACLRDFTCPMTSFTDLNKNAWYHDGVHYVLEHGIFHGYGNGTFGPTDTMSRGWFIEALWNMEGNPALEGDLGFEDVDETSKYFRAVLWSVTKKYTVGYSDSEFGADDTVSREQVVTILYRYAMSKNLVNTTTDGQEYMNYTDWGDVSTFALAAMRWAVSVGIVNGIDGQLHPLDGITRAEAATMIMRFREIYNA